MGNIFKNTTNIKLIRYICIALAILIFLALISSLSFISTMTIHECTGEDCPICHELNQCRSFLAILGMSFSIPFILIAIKALLSLCVLISNEVNSTVSPVKLKVKLVN